MIDCLDCGVEISSALDDGEREHYMVHNSVWAQSGLKPEGGCLCILCLEARIGRKLMRVDFTDVPLNNPDLYGNFSQRLLDRLAVSDHDV